LEESSVALNEAVRLSGESETTSIRATLCKGLIAERGGEFPEALAYFEEVIFEISKLRTTSGGGGDDEDEGAGNTNMGAGAGAGAGDDDDEEGASSQLNSSNKEIQGEALLHMAAVKKDIGDFDEADAIVSRILTDNPTSMLRANALCLEGVIHEVRKEFAKAEISYRTCCESVASHSQGLERLGRLYLRYRETIPYAVNCFSKILSFCPHNSSIWYLIGRCYMTSKQYSEAYIAYNEAVNCEPNEPYVWVSLGVLYYAHGQYKESLGMFARALRLKPDCVEAWYNLGVVYELNGNKPEANRAYAKAKESGLSVRLEQVGLILHEPTV
jgi:tetratricopeptide (TPR) repeat protein